MKFKFTIVYCCLLTNNFTPFLFLFFFFWEEQFHSIYILLLLFLFRRTTSLHSFLEKRVVWQLYRVISMNLDVTIIIGTEHTCLESFSLSFKSLPHSKCGGINSLLSVINISVHLEKNCCCHCHSPTLVFSEITQNLSSKDKPLIKPLALKR